MRLASAAIQMGQAHVAPPRSPVSFKQSQLWSSHSSSMCKETSSISDGVVAWLAGVRLKACLIKSHSNHKVCVHVLNISTATGPSPFGMIMMVRIHFWVLPHLRLGYTWMEIPLKGSLALPFRHSLGLCLGDIIYCIRHSWGILVPNIHWLHRNRALGTWCWPTERIAQLSTELYAFSVRAWFTMIIHQNIVTIGSVSSLGAV